MKLSLGLLLCVLFAYTTAFSQNSTMAFADSLLKAGQYTEGVAAFTKVLEKEPNNEMALRGRGFCYGALNQNEKGIADYQKATQINPQCIVCEYHLIRMLFSSAKNEQAKKKIDSCLLVYADRATETMVYVEIMGLNADYYLMENNEGKASEVFNSIVTLYPDSSWAYFLRADFEMKTDAKSSALKDVNKAIELKNTDARYYTLKAKIYLTINYVNEAYLLANQAITLDSTNFEGYWIRANIHQYNKKYDSAIQDMGKVLSIDTGNWAFYSFLSDLYHTQKNMDSMCWCTQKVIDRLERQPLDAETKTVLAQNQHQKAAFCNANQAGFYYQRGVAMYNLGLYDSAVAYYDMGLKKFPKHPILLNFRANAYLELRLWDNAEKDYWASISDEKLLLESVKERFNGTTTLKPEVYMKGVIASTYLSVSEVNLYKQKYEKAIWAIDTAIAITPILPDIPLYLYYNTKGRIYMAMGDFDKAFEIFEEVKMLAPDNSLGYLNMALARVNKALGKKDLFSQFSVSGSSQNLMSFNYKSPPIKLTDAKSHLLKDALNYCNMAVELAKEEAQPYLIRGYVKQLMGNPAACQDVRKAMYLGNADAAAYYQSICR